jgi:hypothetical protein
MKTYLLTGFLVLLLLLVTGCNTVETNISQHDISKESQAPKDVSETLEDINPLLAETMKELESTDNIYELLNNTNNPWTVYSIYNMHNSKIMEEFNLYKSFWKKNRSKACELVSANIEYFDNIHNKIAYSELNAQVVFSKKLKELKNPVLSHTHKISNALSSVDNYCNESSILLEMDINEKFKSITSSMTEKSELYDFDYWHSILPSTLSEKKSTKIGKVGDRISKRNVTVLLDSVDKDFIHWDLSFNINDREWTNSEWDNSINKYKIKILETYDEETRNKLIDELVTKYQERVPPGRIFVKFNFEIDKSADEFVTIADRWDVSINEHVTLFDKKKKEKIDIREKKAHNQMLENARGLFQKARLREYDEIYVVVEDEKCIETYADLENTISGNICHDSFIFEHTLNLE